MLSKHLLIRYATFTSETEKKKTLKHHRVFSNIAMMQNKEKSHIGLLFIIRGMFISFIQPSFPAQMLSKRQLRVIALPSVLCC